MILRCVYCTEPADSDESLDEFDDVGYMHDACVDYWVDEHNAVITAALLKPAASIAPNIAPGFIAREVLMAPSELAAKYQVAKPEVEEVPVYKNGREANKGRRQGKGRR